MHRSSRVIYVETKNRNGKRGRKLAIDTNAIKVKTMHKFIHTRSIQPIVK